MDDPATIALTACAPIIDVLYIYVTASDCPSFILKGADQIEAAHDAIEQWRAQRDANL